MAKSMPWRHRLGWLMATALTLGFISASCPAADEEGSTDAAVAVDSSEAATATQPQAENDAGEQEAQQQEQQEEQLDESTASAQDDPTDTPPAAEHANNSAPGAERHDPAAAYEGLPTGPSVDTPSRAIAPSITAAPADPIAPPPVTTLNVILEWTPGPQHAALLVAQHKGLFRRRGLDVHLKTPADPDVAAKLVAASQADLALTDQLSLHAAVDDGRPIMRVATLVELPLAALVVRDDINAASALSLIDHRVGYAQQSDKDVLLRAILQQEGLNLSHVEAKDVHFSIIRAMSENWVDAVVGGHGISLPRELGDLGVATRVMSAASLGIPIHDGLILVANQEHYQSQQDAIRSFIDSIEEATRWIIEHPTEAWDIMVQQQPTMDSAANAAAWPDIRRRLSLRPAAMDHGRYRRVERYLHDQGIVKEITPVSRLGRDPG